MDRGRSWAPSRGVGAGRSTVVGLLVPGYPQWAWRQRERGLVLFGTFAAALGVGAFAWGSATGLVILGFAFGAHVFSAADAIRQAAFPGFGPTVPFWSAAAGLGLGLYAPALAMAWTLAWPGRADGAWDGYLVDRTAYRRAAPRPGDWIWARLPGSSCAGAARVVAEAGRRVEWADGRFRVAGAEAGWAPPEWPLPESFAFEVPAGHLLVRPGPARPPRVGTIAGLVLLPRERVEGRAWARLYPIGERRLLR